MSNEIRKYRRTLTKSCAPRYDKIAGVFPVGFLSVIASKAGVGKTWLTLKLTADLSVGGKILSGLVPEEPARKVVILAGETGINLLNARYARTNWDIDETNISIYGLQDMYADNVSLDLYSNGGRATFCQIMEEEQPDIVFIDTFMSFSTADENNAKEVGVVLSFLQAQASQRRVAIVINHHMRKGCNGAKKVSQDEVIGSSAMSRLASVVFVMYKSDDDSQVIVENVKNWDTQVPKFTYQIVTTGEGTDIVADYITAGGSKRIRFLFDAFYENCWRSSEPLSLDDIGLRTGINPQVLRYYVNEYAGAGKLLISQGQSKTGTPKYYYSKK